MAAPSSFDHGAEDWDEFKSWLKENHLKGNDMLGMGIDDVGFVAFNQSHIVKERPNFPYVRPEVVRILQDPDDDPSCYIHLVDECNASPIQMQISWSRHFFLPIEEADYCICEECRKLIPDDDIRRFRFEAGNRDTLPRICDDCAEKHDRP